MIRQMEKVSLRTQMETNTTVNGKMTQLMDMASTCTLMAQNMKATGRMICRMGLAMKHGQTDRTSEALTKTV